MIPYAHVAWSCPTRSINITAEEIKEEVETKLKAKVEVKKEGQREDFEEERCAIIDKYQNRVDNTVT